MLFAIAMAPSLVHSQGVRGRRTRQPSPSPSPFPLAPSRLVSRSSNIIEQQGLRFKDLNRNGALDPYEDWRLTPSARAKDLVGRMTLEDKAGMMMHGTARSPGAAGAIGVGTGYDTTSAGKLIRDVGINSCITRLSGDPRTLAAEDNKLQEIAEKTRLGVPLTISTDPRNHFQYTIGTSTQSGKFLVASRRKPSAPVSWMSQRALRIR